MGLWTVYLLACLLAYTRPLTCAIRQLIARKHKNYNISFSFRCVRVGWGLIWVEPMGSGLQMKVTPNFLSFFSFLLFHVGLERRSIHIIYRCFKLSRNPSQPFLWMIFCIYNKHISRRLWLRLQRFSRGWFLPLHRCWYHSVLCPSSQRNNKSKWRTCVQKKNTTMDIRQIETSYWREF